MVGAPGDVLPKNSRYEKDGDEPARVANNGKKKCCYKNEDFFPDSILRQMAVDGGEHRDCHERTDAAATFVDLELKGATHGMHRVPTV